MKLFTCFTLTLALLVSVSVSAEQQQQQQQRVLRRVIKSTPTASQLGRIRQVTVRSAENGAVAEISSKEAASFGQRAANETAAPIPQAATVKTKSSPATTTTTSTTQTPSSSTTSTTTPTPSTSASPSRKPKASERQQASVQPEVELLSSAPSSWQTMTAVEAPAAMLIATGVRASETTADLASSSSNGDLQRASSATKGAYTSSSSSAESVGETFSRLRQQQTTRQQQSFFYPQPAKTSSKTSTATKTTHWYQPASSTTARPAPLIQEEQQYEQQQSEQYIEQQAEYNAAPPGQAEPFAFDFNTRDSNGNGQYRKEESDKNGVVRGSYGYMDASGVYRHVEYVADQNGFRANIKSNEPGLMAEASQSGPNAETQPASIRLATSPSGRLTSSEEVGSSDTGNWSGELNNAEAAAVSPPNFESIHKPERVRVARHFRN